MSSSTSPLMLSVSGLRGIIGQSLTEPIARRYGAALGKWFLQLTSNTQPHIVLGRDSRPSGQWIEDAVATGLDFAGCRVTSIGIASTPGVAIMARHLHADGGVEITASHNPGQWNGIKALRHDGAAPSAEQAATIIELFHQQPDLPSAGLHCAPVKTDNTLLSVHRDAVLANIDAEVIKARRFKVVLESVHGAGGPETAALLAALGVELVHLYAEPTGEFPHAPEPTEANLTGLCAAVREHKADIGFAQDPDADRLALVDEKGRYIGEEYSLALAALHVLSKPTDCNPWVSLRKLTVCANLSTSRMLDDVAARCGAAVIRTKVGEANVAAAMQRHHSPIGGEGNGGIIFPPCTFVRNSLAGIGLVLEMLAQRKAKLSAIVGQLPHYAMIKDKIALTPGQPAMTAGTFAPALLTAFPEARVDQQDGLRLDWPDRWVHVRTSNTEPIMRVIAEAPKERDAKELVAKVRKALGISD